MPSKTKPTGNGQMLVLNLGVQVISWTTDEAGERQLSERTSWHRVVSFSPQTFQAVAGRVPILIETKQLDYPVGPLEERVARLIVAYGQPVAIHSFSPDSLGWFAEHLPSVPRGQIAMDYAHAGTSLEYTSRGEVLLSGLHKWALSNLLRYGTSRPSFVSYDLNDLPRIATTVAHWLGLPIVAWTVNAPDAAVRAQEVADNTIFETIRPPSAR